MNQKSSPSASFSFSLSRLSDNAGREIAAREAFPLAFADKARTNPGIRLDFSRWHLVGTTFKNLIHECLSPFLAWLEWRVVDPVLTDDADTLFDADGHSLFTPDTQPADANALDALAEPYLLLSPLMPLTASQAIWLKNNIRRLIHLGIFQNFAPDLTPLDRTLLQDRQTLVTDEIATLFCTLESHP